MVEIALNWLKKGVVCFSRVEFSDSNARVLGRYLISSDIHDYNSVILEENIQTNTLMINDPQLSRRLNSMKPSRVEIILETSISYRHLTWLIVLENFIEP
jgi:hypothetical protein